MQKNNTNFKKFIISNTEPVGFIKDMVEGLIEEFDHYYNNTKPNDIPWYYNERALVGFITTGLRQKNAVVLQEYTCKKGQGSKAKNGRADLWVQWKGNKILLEMKAIYGSIWKRNFPWKEKKLIQLEKDACKQAEEYSEKTDYYGTVCILQLYSFKNEFKEYFDNKKEYSWNSNKIKKLEKNDFYFTIYPKDEDIAEKLQWGVKNKERNRYYPGIVVWGKLQKS